MSTGDQSSYFRGRPSRLLQSITCLLFPWRMTKLSVFSQALEDPTERLLLLSRQRSLQECPPEDRLPDPNSSCDAVGQTCQFTPINCPVFDEGTGKCTDNFIYSFCDCTEDNTWACQVPGCQPCLSCQYPYMEIEDIMQPCSFEGQQCPYKAGTCPVWDGETCVPEPVIAQCFCTPDLEWLCEEIILGCPDCPSRETHPPAPHVCPEPYLTDNDIANSNACNDGETCPFLSGICEVWDDAIQSCVEKEVITECSCVQGQWICVVPLCPICTPNPPPSLCPDPYLGEEDFLRGCTNEGGICPFLAGQCEFWNGEECAAKDIVADCQCLNGQWMCNVPGCAPCIPFDKTCPAPYLTENTVTDPCLNEGEKCPFFIESACETWNGTHCVRSDFVSSCSCSNQEWVCQVPSCDECTPPGDTEDECPSPYLTASDVNDGCSTKGLACPYNTGSSCLVWDGNECRSKDIVTSCSCDGSMWQCILVSVTCKECPDPNILIEHTIQGLSQTLSGVSSLTQNDIAVWEDTMELFVLAYFDDSSSGVEDFKTEIVVVNRDFIVQPTRRTRALGQENRTTIIYDQTVVYFPSGGVLPREAITMPFATEKGRQDFIAALKGNGAGFGKVTSISGASLPSNTDGHQGSTSNSSSPVSNPTLVPTISPSGPAPTANLLSAQNSTTTESSGSQVRMMRAAFLQTFIMILSVVC